MSIDLSFDPTVYPRNTAAHPNPLHDYSTGFIPHRLKDVMRWGEYLLANSPHVRAVIKKFGEYPITSFVYETTSPNERERHRELYERVLNVKGLLTRASCDKMTYGNVLISFYQPFNRFLVCPSCGPGKSKTNIRQLDYKFTIEKTQFKFTCPVCKHDAVAQVEDVKVFDKKRIRFIFWDPKSININHNPITGESVYYYEIPEQLIERVASGDKVLINSMPMEFLKAMRKKRLFRFADGQLYHMKEPGPSGFAAQHGWGFPPVTTAIKLFMFAATLRKANEAIALEHITPMRILFPQAAGASGDPYSTISLDTWKRELLDAVRRKRVDPLHIVTLPTAVGIENLGGDGRAMLTLGELQEAEKNIVLAFGVPLEFLEGGLGQTRGEITLRMIENQLQTHIEDLNGLLEWIEQKLADFFGFSPVYVKLRDFKMVDDSEKKQFVLQLWSQGKVSDTTVAEMFDVDLEHERDQRSQDTLDDLRAQIDLQAAQQKIQNSLSMQAQQQAMMGQSNGLQYDQQAVVAQADQIAQELMGLDVGTRRSRLDALKSEDLVMAAVVRERLEQMQQDEQAAMKAGA